MPVRRGGNQAVWPSGHRLGAGEVVRIRTIRPRFHHERVFVGELTRTAEDIGHTICSSRPDLVIQFGTQERHWPGPTLFAECGWLPRWWFQLSHTGINAQHHLAPLKLERLDKEQRWKAVVHLKQVRAGVGSPGWAYLDMDAPPVAGAPERFILAPLQMEMDTNMENAPEELRTNQGFVDTVTDLVLDRFGDVPVIFKQHPHSQAASQLALKMRRDCDEVYAHNRASVYSYLKHRGCDWVVTANSNVYNDALLFDVAAHALGDGIWPPESERPYNNLEYVYALMRAQWRLRDARSPQRVEQAIEEAMA